MTALLVSILALLSMQSATQTHFARVDGVVAVLGTSEPVEGVSVTLGGRKQVTAANGSFTFTDVTPGTYSLNIDYSSLLAKGYFRPAECCDNRLLTVPPEQHINTSRIFGSM